MSSIKKMAGALSSCGGFQDSSFAFQDWKYADKRHKWKEKIQKNAQFPEHSLWHCLSRNSTLFSTDRSAWLDLNQQGSEVSDDTLGAFRTLWSKKSTFLKLKVSWTIFYILTSTWKKNHKICIGNWLFAMCPTDLTCGNATI